MLPLIKANELIEKFRGKILTQHSAWNLSTENSFPIPLKFANHIAKECALVAINEIISELEQLRKPEYTTFVLSYDTGDVLDGYEKIDYWKQVKEELEKFEQQ